MDGRQIHPYLTPSLQASEIVNPLETPTLVYLARDRCKTLLRYSRRQFLLTNLGYAFTPALRRIVIIGHQFVKADWNRFKPTKAVKRNQ